MFCHVGGKKQAYLPGCTHTGGIYAHLEAGHGISFYTCRIAQIVKHKGQTSGCTALLLIMLKSPEAETEASAVPRGSVWHWSCPGSPCSCFGRHLSVEPRAARLSWPWSNYTETPVHQRWVRNIRRLWLPLPIFILCLSYSIHQYLQTLPPHVAALFVEVKGDVAEDTQRGHRVNINDCSYQQITFLGNFNTKHPTSTESWSLLLRLKQN